jgi:hypothetical protein
MSFFLSSFFLTYFNNSLLISARIFEDILLVLNINVHVFPLRKEKENLFTCMELPVLMGFSPEVGKQPQSGSRSRLVLSQENPGSRS